MKKQTAEEYLDEQFPKGETKYRGQAMVLLALAKQETLKQFLEIIDKYFYCSQAQNILTHSILTCILCKSRQELKIKLEKLGKEEAKK